MTNNKQKLYICSSDMPTKNKCFYFYGSESIGQLLPPLFRVAIKCSHCVRYRGRITAHSVEIHASRTIPCSKSRLMCTYITQNTKYTYLSTYIIRMEWLQHGLCEQSSQRSDTQYKVDEQLGGL